MSHDHWHGGASRCTLLKEGTVSAGRPGRRGRICRSLETLTIFLRIEYAPDLVVGLASDKLDENRYSRYASGVSLLISFIPPDFYESTMAR
jgi:hypothetical protein